MTRLRCWRMIGLALVTLVTLSSPSTAQDYPLTTGSLVVGSDNVAAGASTTVAGSGCAPGAAVSISYADVNIGSTTASATGDFSTSVSLPDSASGTGTLSTSCNTPDGGTLVLSASVAANQSTTTTTGPVRSTSDQLAVTGIESWVYVTVGSALALVGVVTVLMSRRTRSI